MRRCYVDCTNTLYTGLNTGIQRVVRNIVSRCSSDEAKTIEFVPVFASHGRFYRFEKDTRDPLVATKALNHLLGGIRNTVDRLFDFVRSDEKGEDVAIPGEDAGISATWHAHTIRQSRRLVPLILKSAFFVDKLFFNLRPVTFEKGDVLFLADVFWNTVLMDTLKRARNENAIHVVLVCDIFPVLYPQFVHKGNVDGFVESLPYVFNWADGVLSISRSSLEEIMSYGSQYAHQPLYEYFHLGADFKDVSPDPERVRGEIKEMFAGDATFLMVGTIEPRKNHQYVLEAFQHLWERYPEARLCFIGRVGWKCKDTLAEIYASPQYGTRLFMINDATDTELNYCYSNAKAIIIASIAEGFGLPLVEALHFGRTVFASDIPVFREIGGDVPRYFSLDRPSDLVDKIVANRDVAGPAGGTAYAALSWDASIADLFAKISMMAERIDRMKHQSQDAQVSDG